MFNFVRRASTLLLSLAVLSGAASPAFAATSGNSGGFVAAPDAVVIPYGSTGPVVLDLLANDAVPSGLDMLPGNNANGIFGYNRSICAAVDSGSICEINALDTAPAFVQALTLPGDFVGVIPIVHAGSDFYAIHQKNRLLLVALPYEGASGALNFDYSWAAAGSDGVPGMVMTSTASVSIGSPEISAVDDYFNGAGADGAIAFTRPDGTTAIAEGKTLNGDINQNDLAVLPGRKTTFSISKSGVVEIPEGIIKLEGTRAAFYSYSPSFTGKTTPVPYDVCSSYTIIPTAPQDAGQKQNLRTDTVCSTAFIVFEIPERPTFLAPPLEVWAPVQPPVVPAPVEPVEPPASPEPAPVEPVEPPAAPEPAPAPVEPPASPEPAPVEPVEPPAVPERLANTGAGDYLVLGGLVGLGFIGLGAAALIGSRRTN